MSYMSTWRHITQLKKSGKFKKTSKGAFYNDIDANELSKQLGFIFPSPNNNKNFQK